MPTNNINMRGAIASDPIRNFRFLVKFLPLTHAGYNDGGLSFSTSVSNVQIGFTSVSGLAISTESIPYREGGYNTTVHQVPGQTTFSPVTFQRGVTIGTDQNWNWMRRLFMTVAGGAYVAPDARSSFRADVEIHVLNHPVPYDTGARRYGTAYSENDELVVGDDLVVARFRLYNAWPTTVAYSDLNAGDNALMVEQMTLVHEGMDMHWATQDAPGNITAAPTF